MQSGKGAMLSRWQQYLLNKLWRDPIRIFIAMSGCTLFAWYCGEVVWTIPLILGVVAAALADLDDDLTGRLKNILITLACFALAASSVELLIPYPLWFVIGLGLSTAGFILLGALGQRYATIAFGALLLAIYTMLGSGLFKQWYIQPLFLLAGAICYYLLTLISHLLFPIRPVQEQLILTYQQLAHYFESKAQLFDPDQSEDDQPALLATALANSHLVTQLNTMKLRLQSRLTGERAALAYRRTLLYYFVAQEIHERAHSSHLEYQQIRQRPQFTELLFRLQRLLMLQGNACRQVAESLAKQQPYQHDNRFARNFRHLDQLIGDLQQQLTPEPALEALIWLVKNLKAVDDQLAAISSEHLLAIDSHESDTHLSEEGLTGWRDLFSRVIGHLTPNSLLFRHAIRLCVVLCAGYGILQLFQLERGYWIMLTSLFVCQPNYQATQKRLGLRIVGTLAGIALGLPLLWLVPSQPGELTLIVVSGVLFFVFRQIHYAHATLFITLMVLFCFDLLGQGFDVAWQRICYTLLGCALAWLAVTWIFPDWRYRQLPKVMDRALAANYRYLAAVLQQYQEGKDNRMSYRVARREAHNADAELTLAISHSSAESWSKPEAQEAAARLLCLNHSLLGYISALGAHRRQVTQSELLSVIDQLRSVAAEGLAANSVPTHLVDKTLAIQQAISQLDHALDPQGSLLLQQTTLLTKVLPDIERLKQKVSDR